jgi:D-alanyl-D-alanine carboxypeptidase
MYRKLGIVVVLLALSILQITTAVNASITAPSRQGQPHNVSKEKLQELADQAVQDGLVGVSFALYTPDDGMILIAAGLSDKQAGTKLKTTDISRIASSSKVFVGVAAMQLVQDGKVSVEDKIAKYLDADNAAHIANADSATVAQVLMHTSGIYDYFNQGAFGADMPDKTDFTLNEALQYAWDQPANFEPGLKYSYSNTNTVLLAKMIETVTGKPFAQVLRERIYEPLELKNTFVELFEKVPVKIARGYEFFPEGDTKEIGDTYAGRGLPDGAIVTTPEDMVKFMRGAFADYKILDKATAELMTAAHEATDDGGNIGYHIFVTSADQGTRVEHDGRLDGYQAVEMHYPESGVTLAIWSNSGGQTQEQVFAQLVEDILVEAFNSEEK